jgi:hypothetical protein
MLLARPFLLAPLIALAACGGDERKPAPDSTAAPKLTPADVPSRAVAVSGFRQPESVRYDSALDAYFVSNVNGEDHSDGGHGFISRMRPDGSIDSLNFIAGGHHGVTLTGPRGLAIAGDTLWVADIDVVRAFDKNTGAPTATVDLRPLGAVLLNDVAIGPDGAIYITDTGPDGKSTKTRGNRIFRIDRRHHPSVALHSDSLGSPNGITWDARGKRFIIVQWGGTHILAWHPGDAQPRTIGFGGNQSDGVEVLPDGRLAVTSWAEKALILRSGADQLIVRGLESPADIGVDTRRQRIAIPLLTKNRVELWDIPPAKQ